MDSRRRDLPGIGAGWKGHAFILGKVRSGHCHERIVESLWLARACGSVGSSLLKTMISNLWSFHDYTTIAPGTLSDMLARVALSAPGRARCLERTRNICRNNLPLFRSWMESQGSIFSLVEPKAGAIAYVRYDLPINSTALIERLLKEKSVLMVPGDHFGMDNFLRIGYGAPAGTSQAGA